MSLLQNEKLEELRNLGIEEIEVLLDHRPISETLPACGANTTTRCVIGEN